MKLINVEIFKYKSFETTQSFEVQEDITVLVGMNESGKTSVLEAIAKTKYFQEDSKFKFNLTHDYPRREKKAIDKEEKTPIAVKCTYKFSEQNLIEIEQKVGKGVFNKKTFSISSNYKNGRTIDGITANLRQFIENKTSEFGISSKALNDKLEKVKNPTDLNALIAEYKDATIIENLNKFKPFITNKWEWDNPIAEYIFRVLVDNMLPKFLYYDEYYSLPSRIVIEKLIEEDLDDEELKTAKSLLELSNLNPQDILNATDFEDYIAELEATEAIISDELFKYWTTNQNLNIEFKIEAKEQEVKRNINTQYGSQEVIDVKIVEHILDIRVKNSRSRVSLPLKNRSKGFNWFFSFLVWFKKIQEDKSSSYILLLDEPGLNLHASAQADLLRFFEDLSNEYQIIYTTHSPFSIPSENLERVRTVLETKDGSKISDSIQEKDPNTLFPLQAALGYDIAQNLFIGKKNLLVEGVSDLIFLQTLSAIFEDKKKIPINKEIVIVPTGGLEKVATFISLLRGNQLEIACLLDNFTEPKGQAKFENLINQKLIHKNKVRFFNEYLTGYSHADIEDLFDKEEYLKFFNSAFTEYADISLSDLDVNLKSILQQINKHLGISRFNHYRVANEIAKQGLSLKDFSKTTIENFEKLFTDINKIL